MRKSYRLHFDDLRNNAEKTELRQRLNRMKTILIIEDDIMIHNALGELLRVSGYQVF